MSLHICWSGVVSWGSGRGLSVCRKVRPGSDLTEVGIFYNCSWIRKLSSRFYLRCREVFSVMTDMFLHSAYLRSPLAVFTRPDACFMGQSEVVKDPPSFAAPKLIFFYFILFFSLAFFSLFLMTYVQKLMGVHWGGGLCEACKEAGFTRVSG